MIIAIQGTAMEMEDRLVGEYESMFNKVLDEREIRCHIAAAFDRPVDDVLQEVGTDRIAEAVSSLIVSEISMFREEE
jgi:hypothetical protein